MKKLLLIVVTALAAISVSQAQSLTIDPPSQNRSGLIRLRGTGFGNGNNSSVLINSLRAPVARWQDDLIECYVPEQTALGAASVVVSAFSAASRNQPQAATLNVLPRETVSGRIKWRLKLADQYVPNRPIVGSDGTIYTMGSFGHVYAVNRDGTVRWVASPTGGVSGTLALLKNGNLVVGGGGGVQALSSVDGSRLWSFPLQTPLVAGPSVGPDGNIYAADDSRWSQSVIGAFILSPNGDLLWSGGKYYRRGGGWTPQEVKFGGNHAYFWSDYSSTTDPDVLGGLNALYLGGGLDWRVTDGVGILPDAHPNGNVAHFRPSTIEMWNAQGGTIWSQNLGQFGGQEQGEAVVASDGRTYFRTINAKLHAISPSGQVLYSKLIGGIVSNHVVRPDANQIALQYQPNFGLPAQIQGYDKNANLQWSQELPIEFGVAIVCYNLMTYDPAGTILYFGTAGPYTAASEAQSYLYALEPRVNPITK
jgi:hypothetical protein